MYNGDGGNLSPIGNYNKVLSGSLSMSSDMLTGSVDMTKFNLDADKELANDLDILSAAGNASGVNKTEGAGNIADKFAEALGNSIENVNNLNHDAHKAVETFATGGNIDVHSVMIASQKAKMSLALATQVRNKAMDAYQTIFRMQV